MMLARLAFMMRAYRARVGPLDTISTMPTRSFCMSDPGLDSGTSSRVLPRFGSHRGPVAPHRFSTLYGFTCTAYAIAGAIGPVVMGRAFDLTGSYAVFLSVLAFAGLMSAILMLTMPQYDRATAPVALAVPAVTSPSEI